MNINTWAKGINIFSTADSLTLKTIAYSNPKYYGDAVYTARDMLGIVVADFPQVSSQPKLKGQNHSNNNEILVYPNPTAGIITIEFPEIGENLFTIELYNMTGQKCYETDISNNTNKKSLDLSKLPKGIYFFKLQSLKRNINFTEKIILLK
ncbi:MAG: T9SS type A sorting domain-containing protein [Saprospiraceae bacterium]|nr:T9SS type A sorting domain-containing protein [Saprospiraceae bacterium]